MPVRITVNNNKKETSVDRDIDKTKPLHFGIVSQSWGSALSKFIIKDVEIKTPIRN